MKKRIPIIVFILFVLACTNNSEGNKTKKSVKEGLNIGNKAPALAYNNPYGNTLALSSLAGKMVLIEFWASWCPPCRRENPLLVETYHAYKEKYFVDGNGFTVYSVSLDKEKQAWVAAIDKDKLSWDSHVSDLKGWEAQAAKTYSINSIPSNLLIDGKGIILAKNLRGEQLAQTLQLYLK